MEISDSRKCNLMNLAKVEVFLDVPSGMLRHYYEELLEDIFSLKKLTELLLELSAKTGLTKEFFVWKRFQLLIDLHLRESCSM